MENKEGLGKTNSTDSARSVSNVCASPTRAHTKYTVYVAFFFEPIPSTTQPQ